VSRMDLNKVIVISVENLSDINSVKSPISFHAATTLVLAGRARRHIFRHRAKDRSAATQKKLVTMRASGNHNFILPISLLLAFLSLSFLNSLRQQPP
jgi:hypothetical protein